MARKYLIGLAERASGFGEGSSCAVRKETCIILSPQDAGAWALA